MKSAAIDLAPRGMKVAILHPGWVQTDMGGPNAEIAVTERRRPDAWSTPYPVALFRSAEHDVCEIYTKQCTAGSS